MKKIFLLLLFVVFQSFSWFGKHQSTSENMVSEYREVADFSKVYFSGHGNLFITQGNKEEIKIESEVDQIANIKTSVSNGTLYIEEKAMGWIKSIVKQPLNIYVVVKDIEELNLAGKGTITANEVLKGKNLVVKVSGTGNVKLELDYDNLSSNITGTGVEYKLNGQVKFQDIQIGGTCTYHAENLHSSKTAVDIKGSGKVNVNVRDELDVKITGHGIVRYLGNPQVTENIFGTGKVKKLKS